MKILFISSTCSAEKYREIYEKRNKPMLDTSQRFFQLFIEGFQDKENVEVECVSILPISIGCYPKVFIPTDRDEVDSIKYNYLGFINLPVLKNLILWFRILFFTLKWAKMNKGERQIICDPTILEAAGAARVVGKLKKIKVCGFVTDFLKTSTTISGKSKNIVKRVMQDVYDHITEDVMQKMDSYIFLTEAMSDYINKKNRPYLIMECIVDKKMRGLSVDSDMKYNEDTVLYAGKLHEKFGLNLLCGSAEHLKSRCIINIFGDGDYVHEIKKKEEISEKIKFNGVVNVNRIIEEERRSTLLINPRPTNNDFTKYSFPSKVAEYMVSGTCVLTTKLSGIPEEYYPHLFFIESETDIGIAQVVDQVLAIPKEELAERGKRAKAFILDNKSCDIQADRCMRFLEQVSC